MSEKKLFINPRHKSAHKLNTHPETQPSYSHPKELNKAINVSWLHKNVYFNYVPT